MILYHYDHCPYCVRARMIFAFTNTPFTLKSLASDDEATPTSLIGKKMLPILTSTHMHPMAESLDIVKYVAKLSGQPQYTLPASDTITCFTEGRIKELIRFLCWPRWMMTPLEEFQTESAKHIFAQRKKW